MVLQMIGEGDARNDNDIIVHQKSAHRKSTNCQA